MDETNKQLVGEVETPLPAAPGYPARYDHHYLRNDVANPFMMLEPLTGRYQVKVTQSRNMREIALLMKDIVDRHYLETDTITLVMDNLSSQNIAEIGLNVLSHQRLNRRIGTIQQLGKQVKAWLKQHQKNPPIVKWQFTTDDAPSSCTVFIRHYCLVDPLVLHVDLRHLA